MVVEGRRRLSARIILLLPRAPCLFDSTSKSLERATRRPPANTSSSSSHGEVFLPSSPFPDFTLPPLIMRASTSAARAAAGLPPRTLVVTPAPAVAAVLAPQQACYSTARSPRTARRVIWPGSNKRKVYASPFEQPKPVEQTPWQPALPAGQLEAYDLSLEWIRSFAGTEEQRAQVNAEHAELRKEIRQAEEELKALRKRKANSSERAEVKAKLGKLVEDRNEVEARLEYMQTWAKYHDPEVRWNWEHGLRESLSLHSLLIVGGSMAAQHASKRRVSLRRGGGRTCRR